MTVNELKQLPKIELHCHLDGSLSKEYVETRLQRAVSFEELSVSEKCTSLVEYLKKDVYKRQSSDISKSKVFLIA